MNTTRVPTKQKQKLKYFEILILCYLLLANVIIVLFYANTAKMTRTPPIKDSRNLRSLKNKNLPQSSTPSSSTPLTLTTNTTMSPKDDTISMKQVIHTSNLLLLQNKEILQKITDVETAIQFLSSKYDELKLKYDQVISDNAQLMKSNTDIESTNTELKHQNFEIMKEINLIKQTELKKNAVIFGVPNVRDHHSLLVTFNNILQKLNINEDDVDIDDIFQKKTTTEQAPIFIKFKQLKNKIDFMQATKSFTRINKTTLNTSDVGFTNINKIVIVDQLTESNRKLLKEAQQLRIHGYKFIWTKNGKIFAKKREEAEVVEINNLNIIHELKSQNITI